MRDDNLDPANKTGLQGKLSSGTLQQGDIDLDLAGRVKGKPGDNGRSAASSGEGTANG